MSKLIAIPERTLNCVWKVQIWANSQGTDETFDQYVTDPTYLAKKWEFNYVHDLMIRGKIVFSSKGVPLEKRLLSEPTTRDNNNNNNNNNNTLFHL